MKIIYQKNKTKKFANNINYQEIKNFYNQFKSKFSKITEYKINSNTRLVDLSQNSLRCFKIRGAMSALNFKHIKLKNIFAASSGSFGLSVAKLCNELNIKCTIAVPKNLSSVKKKKLEKFNCKIKYFKNYEEAKKFCKKKNEQYKKNLYIKGISKKVIIGNASYFFEYFGNKKKLSSKKIAFFIPFGIGSLVVPAIIFSLLAKLDVDIYIAEPESHPKFYNMYTNNKLGFLKKTLADGAAVAEVPIYTKKIISKNIQGISVINENEIKNSIKTVKKLTNNNHEGASVLGYALYEKNLIKKKYDYNFIFLTGRNC